MQYITKKCPHCGHAYSVMQPAKSGFYGSPFRKCSICNSSFIDDEYREIAVDGIRKVDNMKLSWNTFYISYFPFYIGVVLSVMYLSGFEDMGIGWLIGGIAAIGVACWLVIDEIRGYKDRQEYLRKEKIASEARLSNVNYAVALAKHGFNVPAKYLSGCKDIDFTKKKTSIGTTLKNAGNAFENMIAHIIYMSMVIASLVVPFYIFFIL